MHLLRRLMNWFSRVSKYPTDDIDYESCLGEETRPYYYTKELMEKQMEKHYEKE